MKTCGILTQLSVQKPRQTYALYKLKVYQSISNLSSYNNHRCGACVSLKGSVREK